MTKEEIIAALKALIAEFNPDQATDWAYEAVEVLENIVKEK